MLLLQRDDLAGAEKTRFTPAQRATYAHELKLQCSSPFEFWAGLSFPRDDWSLFNGMARYELVMCLCALAVNCTE